MSRNQRPGAGSPLTKGIGSLIGLAAEIHAHRKEKKATEKATAATQNSTAHTLSRDCGLDGEERDEEDWALDEASGELCPDGLHEDDQKSTKVPIVSISNTITPSSSIKPLPLPVILPQRRPQPKSRGFVRAYAPILGECKDIDQATFLNFLDEFYRSSQVRGRSL